MKTNSEAEQAEDEDSNSEDWEHSVSSSDIDSTDESGDERDNEVNSHSFTIELLELIISIFNFRKSLL